MMRPPPMLGLAAGLEEGRFRGPLARALSRVWEGASRRAVVRPLPAPPGVRVVAIGGATLGGSGKTPLAIACARELARHGRRVALVGHAYRARPGQARIVDGADPLEQVGDEALLAARMLEAHGVRVVVGPSRAAAVELAARVADVLVLDGVLQTAPERATLSLLAVDAAEPWGRSASVPPCGDLRAPRAALLDAADAVVRVGEGSVDARVVSNGAWLGGRLVPWPELRGRRIGLALALARPDRVLRLLARRGIEPVAIARARDHAAIAPRLLAAPVDLWLASPKCALHAPRQASAPLATIDHDLVLGEVLSVRLLSASPRLAP
jgi:tetraacyldisaccharide 4'-kinase